MFACLWEAISKFEWESSFRSRLLLKEKRNGKAKCGLYQPFRNAAFPVQSIWYPIFMGRCFDGSSSMLPRRSQILRGCCFERFEGIDWNTTSNAFLLRPAQIVLSCITNCVTLSLKFFQTLSSQNFTEQRFDRSMIERIQRIFSFRQSSSLLNIIFRTPIKNYYLKRIIFVR